MQGLEDLVACVVQTIEERNQERQLLDQAADWPDQLWPPRSASLRMYNY